jgi:predicted phosphodiesterase
LAKNEALKALSKIPDGDLLAVPIHTLQLGGRKFNVRWPKAAKRIVGNTITALLWGDTHFPHQCDKALAVVAAIAKDIQPDVLCHMGDLIDSADLSEKFKKNPARKETLQDEIDMGRAHLARMRVLVPDAQFILLEGNHEERMTRVLWNMEGPARALSLLTDVQKALSWPSLLGLDFMDIQWVPYGEQTKQRFLPKFLLKHGTIVRQKGGYTAHSELSKYGMSGASGHTHRLSDIMHRDHNGNHIWIETGCTCSLEPEYTPDPDWQNGCVVLTLHRDTGAFQAEKIYIHKGNAIFRGKEYTA